MAIVVGIFEDMGAAERGVNRLDQLDLPEGSIHVHTRQGIEGGRDSFTATLASAFSAADTPVSQHLVSLGLDREEAEFYETELGDDGVLVAVETDDDTMERVAIALREANGVVRDD